MPTHVLLSDIEPTPPYDTYDTPQSITYFVSFRLGIPVRFVTNETQKTRQSLVAKLHRLGYEMPEAEVFPPALAMANIIKGKTPPNHIIFNESRIDWYLQPRTSTRIC